MLEIDDFRTLHGSNIDALFAQENGQLYQWPSTSAHGRSAPGDFQFALTYTWGTVVI